METFKLPLSEIRKRFTTSEIVLMAWRSQEQHLNFKARLKKDDSGDDTTPYHSSGKKRKNYSDSYGPDRMPDKFFDENGDLNLSKVTSQEARGYLEGVLRIPFPPGVSKIREESDTSSTIRNAYGIRR